MGDHDSFITMKRWLENIYDGKHISDYLLSCGYNNIAIYGVGDIGKLLYREIKGSSVKVQYFADRNAEAIRRYDGIKVILPIEISTAEDVDIIIVSVTGAYDAINKVLMENYPQLPVVSLKDLVYEIS